MKNNKYENVSFDSNGSKINGWLFLPKLDKQCPLVILCHGTAAQKDFGFQIIGKDLAERGIGALAIDYRGSGDSENIKGLCRCYISPSAQIDDVIAAIDYVRHNKKVNSNKIGLFGESMGATITMLVARRLELIGEPIQAVYAQSPALFDFPKWPLSFVKFVLINAMKDLFVRNVFINAYQKHPRDSNCYLPDSFCFWAVIPDNPLGGWNNIVSARSILNVIGLIISGNVKKELKYIKTPTLISQGSLDRFLGSSYNAINKIYKDNPNASVTIYTYEGEHMSAIPMVNRKRYENDKDSYQHPSNTYYPDVYKKIFPIYLEFFKSKIK